MGNCDKLTKTMKSASMTTMNINRNWIKIKGIELTNHLLLIISGNAEIFPNINCYVNHSIFLVPQTFGKYIQL